MILVFQQYLSAVPTPPSSLWLLNDGSMLWNDDTYLMDGTRTTPAPPPPSNLWTWADADVLLNDPSYFMDGTHVQPNAAPAFSLEVDAYDNLNGTMDLAWSTLGSAAVDSYNVYVNGVLNQNVTGLQCTIIGLQKASYDPSTQVLAPSLNYDIKIVAVVNGLETSASLDKIITPNPTSLMLATPMKRDFPFPFTGQQY